MRILITAPYNQDGQKELSGIAEVVYRSWKPQGRAYNEEELMALLEETAADALITEHDHVTARVIEAFPALRFIGVCRGTPSNVALDAAARLGIPVFHTPARNAQAVAELFVANVITLLRKTIPARQWLVDGRWDEGAHTSYLEFKGNELAGKSVGLVGFGAIGRRIASMLENFPCTIHFYDPYVTEYNQRYRRMELDELFSESDIVSIHLPVTNDTRGMIDGSLISLMKKDAIFVNTARAAVVKRDGLLEAIENGRIRGAILDVFDHEPPDETDYRLIRHPNVLATPHTAGATDEVEDHHVSIMNAQVLKHFAASAEPIQTK
ncbi:hydroxyacid dehydrogenase [Pedobacter yulinensis]|uniref:Hydroxyacid dehydrogenase n=1 Tax=Pedobacter yulinensis TaxID=2126353 RepID=A0A2T3HQD8_9SPHI|nr:2-hydroxyacid dehydrogenase [Pedobacter yulinensis]PST84662.1 hydroxyacid dehydrogenase [Pedobacter yulinensis]